MSDIIQRLISFIMSLLMPLLTSMGLAVKHFDTIPNVSYGTGETQVMDVYVPTGVSGNASAVLLLHDGDFTNGTRTDLDSDCQTFANRGYVAATMDYSLIKESTFLNPNTTTLTTVLGDIGSAIDKLTAVAREKGLTLNKLALYGVGAGGYYALMFAYTRADYSRIPLKFVAVKAAPTDLQYNLWKNVYSQADFAKLISALSGTNLRADQFTETSSPARDTLSPAAKVKVNSVPTLAAFGGADTTVPFANKTSLEQALTEKNVPCAFVDFPNSDHSMSRDFMQRAEFNDALMNFCSRYL